MSRKSDSRGFLAKPDSDLNLIFVHSMTKAWYCRVILGYTVVRQTATPEPGWFGTITYKRTWILKRAET